MADDVLVVGKGDTMEEARHNHDEALIQLLVQARKANIKFNKDKMQLHMSELLYIGHWISGEGVRPDPSKVLAIQNMATPKSASEVRRFLGMCNYLARFIPNLSQASESLRHLTEAMWSSHGDRMSKRHLATSRTLLAVISFWRSMMLRSQW